MVYARLAAFITLFAAATGGALAGELSLDVSATAALGAAENAETPSARIRNDVTYLADDARAGREAGSQGYLDAAKYVAARFKSIGLAPGADGGWFQTIRLRSGRRVVDAAKMAMTTPDGASVAFDHLDDFLIGQNLDQPHFQIEAPAVFVGYGVTDAETGYEDYAGVNAAGKIVVAFSGAPKNFDSEKKAYYASGAAKRLNASEHGAVGFISMLTITSEKTTPWSRYIDHPEQSSMTWIGPGGAAKADTQGIVATATLSPEGAAKLFNGAENSYAQLREIEDKGKAGWRAFDLPGRLSISGASLISETESPNVVGVLEGSDPNLKDEVLVLSAHLDHVGVKRRAKGDEDAIYNGALDNAIGVSTFLEVGGMFEKAGPARRTIVFLAVTGEEKGLLGSDYFARYPTLGERRIVGDVNLDMPIALYPFTDVVAFGGDRSSLGPMARNAAKSMGIAVVPDPFPEEGIFTRSDHFRFVQQGVPSIFLFLGLGNGGDEVFAHFMKNNYHKPSDDLSQPIDFDAAARFSELNYLIARAVADADAAPAWNDGDFFGDLFAK